MGTIGSSNVGSNRCCPWLVCSPEASSDLATDGRNRADGLSACLPVPSMDLYGRAIDLKIQKILPNWVVLQGKVVGFGVEIVISSGF